MPAVDRLLKTKRPGLYAISNAKAGFHINLYKQPQRETSGNIIGGLSVRIDGTLAILPDGRYSFDGTIRAIPDVYSLHRRTGREHNADQRTNIGRAVTSITGYTP